MASVLFVCQGNLYRSVASAAIFTDKLRRSASDWQAWRVESAGTWAWEDFPTSPEMMTVMARRGLEVTAHRSRRINAGIVSGFNLILCMEFGQKEALQVEFPSIRKNVYLLCEMAGERVQINDPQDTSVIGLTALADEIEDWLERGFARILELGRTNISK